MVEVEWKDLHEIISFEDFDFMFHLRDEKDILQPQLEKLGFINISWGSGETDSFGPLTRVCRVTDKFGNFHYYVYG